MSNTPDSTRDQTPEDRARLEPFVLAAGKTVPGLSSWILVRKLGGGGFGEVWLAKHSWDPDQRSRAIKFCTDTAARKRLVTHERNVVVRVLKHAGRHPNIVPLLDCNLDGDVPWLMYEYVEGGTLSNAIDQWRGLPVPKRVGRAVLALHAMAGALATCHRLQPPLVHRDIKPANVLMAGSVPRITDFGIGSVVPRDSEAAKSGTSAGPAPSDLRGSGTRAYAPPEQLLGAPPDPRDDVYALGVIAYQAVLADLTACPGSDAAFELLNRQLPRELVELIVASVAINPERRPRDAGQWESVLGTLIARARAPVPAPEAQGDPAPPAPIPLRGRGRLARVGALAVALASVAVATILLLPERRPPIKTDATPPQPGETRQLELSPGVPLTVCWVPAGGAQLGAPDDERKRAPVGTDDERELLRGRFETSGFWVGKFEITQQQWMALAPDGRNPSSFAVPLGSAAPKPDEPGGSFDRLGPDRITDTSQFPVESVTHQQCEGFVARLSAVPAVSALGKVALPHENEWEYLCRGGLDRGRSFHFGNELNGRLANCNGMVPFGIKVEGPNLNRTAKVGSYEHIAPHPWGVCDLHGNVAEWCSNRYRQDAPEMVVRGGCSYYDAVLCRTAYRFIRYAPSEKRNTVGFRIVIHP